MKKTKTKGFTLLELLLVIATLALISTFFIGNFTSAQAKARDAQRKSDLRGYQRAVELFANVNNNEYPSYSTIQVNLAEDPMCSQLGLNSCPDDPRSNNEPLTHRYKYISDGTGGGTPDARRYLLWTRLEQPEDGNEVFWVICSDGRNGTIPATVYIVSPACPLP